MKENLGLSPNPEIITDDKCNVVYFSSLLFKDYTSKYYGLSVEFLKKFRENLKTALSPEFKLQELTNTQDIWARDYMPVQLFENKFWNYTYFPDYLNGSDEDKSSITDFRDVIKPGSIKNLDTERNPIIADGGNIVKCNDCIIVTDKIIKENQIHVPGLDAHELSKLIGVDVVVISADPEDPFGHTDGMLRYIKPDTILVRAAQDEEDKEFLDSICNQIKLQRPNIKIERLKFDYVDKKMDNIRHHNWCYINFLRLGNKILVPKLGIRDDEEAISQMKTFFPVECEFIQIDMLQLVEAGGGALNCLSWTMKD